MAALNDGLTALNAGRKFDDLPKDQQLAVFQGAQAAYWEYKILPRRLRKKAAANGAAPKDDDGN